MSKSPKQPGAENDTEDHAKAAIDRRSFLASGAVVGAAAIAEMPAAQAAEAMVWDREVDVLVIGGRRRRARRRHRGAREGRIGADRREELRYRRPRHDEL